MQTISDKREGSKTETLRILKQAGLTSKATYGAVSFDTTKEQQRQMLHRESLRSITGLPKQTITELYKFAQRQLLTQIIETRQEGHEVPFLSCQANNFH